MFMTGSSAIDAERAFTRAARGRRRAALARRLRRAPAEGGQLCVYGEPQLSRPRAGGQPGRARDPHRRDQRDARAQPGRDVRRLLPARGRARSRWERVWLAEHQGAVLPPISVVQVDDVYAVRDGHHRVSVARARGAVSIDATVDAG